MAAIVGEVFEQETFHLPGNFRSFLDIEQATLLLEKVVALGIAVFSVIGRSIAGETRVVQIGLIHMDRRRCCVCLEVALPPAIVNGGGVEEGELEVDADFFRSS